MTKEQRTAMSKKKIIEAAIREFGKNGYKGASVNSICNTGIPKGLLYHNFKNRDEIYIACVKECYDALLVCLKGSDSEYSLQAYMSARWGFFEAFPMKANIIFETMLHCSQHLYKEIEGAKSPFNQFNHDYFNVLLHRLDLREDISAEEAMKHFSLIQLMFNAYFESLDIKGWNLSSVAGMRAVAGMRENFLAKTIDLILYGIAERKNK
ncbi:TetR/AcrR family transcriptional regulator [Eubacterium aggregans]|uniref:TetR/AcrR family transcriptional regulator n=1 Tax=Eubacterium aggregans TaxID=81409 RepID=UPI003F2CF5F8